MRDFVAFDFETANSQRYSICSVGMIFVEDGEITETVYELINPEVEFDPFNISIHGITEENVASAPTFEEFYNNIKGKLENKILIAHYLPFDGYALRDNLSRYNIVPVSKQLLCSYQLSKKLLPVQSSYTLKSMCHYYNIELKMHHNALDDAKACAELFMKLVKEFDIPNEDVLYEKTKIKLGLLNGSNFNTSYKVKDGKLDLTSIVVNQDAENHHIFYGKKVVFTGKLELFTRKQAAQLVADKGAIPQNGLNKETDFIILGDFETAMINGTKSTKLKKAEKMIEEGKSLEIISEEEFLKMLH